MVTGINHVTLSVRNLRISFDFYNEILGFRPLFKSEANAYFLAGKLWFCIEQDEYLRQAPLPEYTHIAFSVDQSQFSKVANRIKESGAEIFKENKSEGDSLYFLDPNGHKLEIHVGTWKTRLDHARRYPWRGNMEFFEGEPRNPTADIPIQKATPDDLNSINALAFRSKCYWPYPIDYLLKCMEALRLSSEDIEKWPVYLTKKGVEVAGFFALKVIQEEARLDHLWIDPRFIGQGIGRQLFARAVQEGKHLGWPSFRIAADPFAEPFYLQLGAMRIGEVQSRIKPDLYLPHLEYQIVGA